MLLLLACLSPQLSGPPTATYSLTQSGQQTGRAWLYQDPLAERVIWNEQLAWELSVSTSDPQSGTLRLALREGQETQRVQLSWQELEERKLQSLLPYTPTLILASPRPDSPKNLRVYEDTTAQVIHDAQGLAVIAWPGVLVVREGLEQPPQVPWLGTQRAPVRSPQGEVGSLHAPVEMSGLPGVVVDASLTSQVDADLLALQGWVVLRSPAADPSAMAALSLPCAPLVHQGPILDPSALAAALSALGCPKVLAP